MPLATPLFYETNTNMKAHKNMIAIAKQTASELTQLENEISGVLKTAWSKVGELLGIIRSKRLYKPLSFNAWLLTHPDWGITRGRADQLIKAAKLNRKLIANNCSELPNEGVAREVIRFPESVQIPEWKAATKNGKAPTAKEVRKRVLQLVRGSSGNGRKPKPVNRPKQYRLTIELEKINDDAFQILKEIMGENAKTNGRTTKLYVTESPERIGGKLEHIGGVLPTMPALKIKIGGAQ